MSLSCSKQTKISLKEINLRLSQYKVGNFTDETEYGRKSRDA